MKNTLKDYSIKARAKSFRDAANGIGPLLREPNAKLHTIATLLVLGIGFAKGLSKTEWCFIIFAIGLVWIAEAINTAIEKLCDLYSTNFNPLIRIIKDVAAAGVIFAALTSAAIGIIIFFF